MIKDLKYIEDKLRRDLKLNLQSYATDCPNGWTTCSIQLEDQHLIRRVIISDSKRRKNANSWDWGQGIVKTHQRFLTMEETLSNQLTKLSKSIQFHKHLYANTFKIFQEFTDNVVDGGRMVVGWLAFFCGFNHLNLKFESS